METNPIPATEPVVTKDTEAMILDKATALFKPLFSTGIGGREVMCTDTLHKHAPMALAEFYTRQVCSRYLSQKSPFECWDFTVKNESWLESVPENIKRLGIMKEQKPDMVLAPIFKDVLLSYFGNGSKVLMNMIDWNFYPVLKEASRVNSKALTKEEIDKLCQAQLGTDAWRLCHQMRKGDYQEEISMADWIVSHMSHYGNISSETTAVLEYLNKRDGCLPDLGSLYMSVLKATHHIDDDRKLIKLFEPTPKKKEPVSPPPVPTPKPSAELSPPEKSRAKPAPDPLALNVPPVTPYLTVTAVENLVVNTNT